MKFLRDDLADSGPPDADIVRIDGTDSTRTVPITVSILADALYGPANVPVNR